ncbi:MULTISPECIES: PIN domain nuclease [unclassified Burkholderia]|uniref:PIN domain nuclease n=1 Tax=unclassified Burkholderia TaxID=2613784 RepID=UPI001422FEF9|nr:MULTISPECIES: PIN domain nuclease [unclassified Burkholderia]NIE57877.1 PIN domain nuclease [Burkholderia sp. Ap-955]NIF09219.1 PIN domain nuclease [Burkholderia sp. Ax-1735]NIG06054.1 PIN domain nuclease [Burkholderia sp. Tr-849]
MPKKRVLVDEPVVDPWLMPGDVIEVMREAFELHGRARAACFTPQRHSHDRLVSAANGYVPKRSRKT